MDPGGGLSNDGLRFVRSRKKFFIPVKVISKKFKGKFLALLKICRIVVGSVPRNNSDNGGIVIEQTPTQFRRDGGIVPSINPIIPLRGHCAAP